MAGKFKKKKQKKNLPFCFCVRAIKSSFSHFLRTLLNRIYMYIYKYILKLYKRKTFSKCCLTIKQKVTTFDGY